jgi:hypothetical protein
LNVTRAHRAFEIEKQRIPTGCRSHCYDFHNDARTGNMRLKGCLVLPS